jgi:hypothetical protein
MCPQRYRRPRLFRIFALAKQKNIAGAKAKKAKVPRVKEKRANSRFLRTCRTTLKTRFQSPDPLSRVFSKVYACPCCFSMPFVHAACPFRIYVLYVHAACPCCMSMLRVHAACPCCMCMLQVHASRQNRTRRTGHAEQDRQNRTGRTGQAEQDRQNRNNRQTDRHNRTGRQDRQNWTGRQDRQNWTSKTGLAEQDWTARTGLPWQDL